MYFHNRDFVNFVSRKSDYIEIKWNGRVIDPESILITLIMKLLTSMTHFMFALQCLILHPIYWLIDFYHIQTHHKVESINKAVQRPVTLILIKSPQEMTSGGLAHRCYTPNLYIQFRNFKLTVLTYQYSPLIWHYSDDHDRLEPGFTDLEPNVLLQGHCSSLLELLLKVLIYRSFCCIFSLICFCTCLFHNIVWININLQLELFYQYRLRKILSFAAKEISKFRNETC